MATIRYFTKGKGNPSTILLRLRHGRKYDLTKSTELLIDTKYWNEKKGAVKQVADFPEKVNIQNDLNNLRNHILNSFNNSYTTGQLINSEWLKTTIDSFFEQDENTDFNYLIDYSEYFIKTLGNKIQPNGKTGVEPKTIEKYQIIINKLKEFEKHQKKRLKVSDVNMTFHKDFIYFLHNIQLLNYNTTGRYLKYVKTIVKSAREYGLKISDDIDKKEFREPKEKTTFVTLTESEIETIFKHDFSEKPYLDNARDWLIIGVWTGARVSDLLKFTNENIHNGFIEYTAQKTQQKIVLPLHPQVLSILDKLNGQFPRPISDQRFNDYIKKVCKEVKMVQLVEGSKRTEVKKKVWRKLKGMYPKYELVSTHICRRSFATNHYGKLPTPVLMAITGHTTEKMFLKYIGKTAMDNAEVLNNFWQDQEHKKNKTAKLKLIKTGTNE
ncbi:phage integrase SAM-like domain-containing protein [Aequorivita sp. KMM 9714]|uniref:phage integrase SAM-like domain-containing protein n=1 Tax=Aequorivita sp. KMM 9714 TaxID=2707173 RepID=UPI0013EE3365|nr:phage integrase SAM-like domain-containing protein [Aequorivita sp. KMM 9714]NGX83113.1 site-specific integrase [Aequorivita sp. KMM 9714]